MSQFPHVHASDMLTVHPSQTWLTMLCFGRAECWLHSLYLIVCRYSHAAINRSYLRIGFDMFWYVLMISGTIALLWLWTSCSLVPAGRALHQRQETWSRPNRPGTSFKDACLWTRLRGFLHWLWGCYLVPKCSNDHSSDGCIWLREPVPSVDKLRCFRTSWRKTRMSRNMRGKHFTTISSTCDLTQMKGLFYQLNGIQSFTHVSA